MACVLHLVVNLDEPVGLLNAKGSRPAQLVGTLCRCGLAGLPDREGGLHPGIAMAGQVAIHRVRALDEFHRNDPNFAGLHTDLCCVDTVDSQVVAGSALVVIGDDNITGGCRVRLRVEDIVFGNNRQARISWHGGVDFGAGSAPGESQERCSTSNEGDFSGGQMHGGQAIASVVGRVRFAPQDFRLRL